MLPFKTIEEAEAALNRTLTFAETLWLNYSADKSDCYLYYHNILFLFLIFSLIPLPVVVVDLLSAANFERFKIQPKVKLSFSEMRDCYKAVMKTFFLVVGPLQLVSYPSTKVKFLGFYFFDVALGLCFVEFVFRDVGFFAPLRVFVLFFLFFFFVLCIIFQNKLFLFFFFVGVGGHLVFVESDIRGGAQIYFHVHIEIDYDGGGRKIRF